MNLENYFLQTCAKQGKCENEICGTLFLPTPLQIFKKLNNFNADTKLTSGAKMASHLYDFFTVYDFFTS